MKRSKMKSSKSLAVGLLLLGAGLMASCDKDILSGQPDWLANSIYGYLQDPGDGCTYKYTLRLIDDMDMKDVLDKTGSKTLFVCDDSKFEEFFRDNDWGVSKYEDLTSAQKKLLLNSAMVNNAYLIEMLSSVSGTEPESGRCMRRETSASIYDSIARTYPAEMPNTDYWSEHRANSKGILVLRDNSTKPMIHFLPDFMKRNSITSQDLSILTNGSATSIDDAYVNGKKIVDRDITCKNGYIHRVDGLMTSSDNMAETIRQQSDLSLFSSLLDRFTAPYYDETSTKEYDRLYNCEDSVFVIRYFAERSAVSDDGLSTDPDGRTVDAQLYFDPGWNQYIYKNTSDITLQYDAGAMLAPTNDALNEWWNGEGKPLKDMYKTWENVPLKVLVKLLNICMINTFSETVPSKFTSIVDNTTKNPIGITTANVDQCYMACNGVVYKTNKVFAPADYSSVSFPALVNQDIMSVIYWGIENLGFESYLNSMDSYYSFIIPTNEAMLQYIDPCSYGQANTVLYQFYYDNDSKSVKAHRYNYNVETKTIDTTTELSDASTTQIEDRLDDLIDNLIIVGDVEDGHTYYKTKGGSTIKITNAGQEGTMTVQGGWQIEKGDKLTVTKIYDQSKTGNGKSYVVDAQAPLSSQHSTYSILKSNPEFSEFYKLLSGSSLMTQKLGGTYTCMDYNINLFDAYNYTIYVPTNDVIQKLHENGILPDWDDYENLTAADFDGDQTALKSARSAIADRIVNFLRYHIQDNAVYIDGSDNNNVSYESSMMNPANKRFYSIKVNSNDHKTMTLVDQLNNKVNVITSGGNYNIMGREFWFQTSRSEDQIYNASDIVVHQIDNALFYDESQKTPWRSVIGISSAKKNFKSRRR